MCFACCIFLICFRVASEIVMVAFKSSHVSNKSHQFCLDLMRLLLNITFERRGDIRRINIEKYSIYKRGRLSVGLGRQGIWFWFVHSWYMGSGRNHPTKQVGKQCVSVWVIDQQKRTSATEKKFPYGGRNYDAPEVIKTKN